MPSVHDLEVERQALMIRRGRIPYRLFYIMFPWRRRAKIREIDCRIRDIDLMLNPPKFEPVEKLW